MSLPTLGSYVLLHGRPGVVVEMTLSLDSRIITAIDLLNGGKLKWIGSRNHQGFQSFTPLRSCRILDNVRCSGSTLTLTCTDENDLESYIYAGPESRFYKLLKRRPEGAVIMTLTVPVEVGGRFIIDQTIILGLEL